MLANGSRACAPGQPQVRPTAEVVLSMSKPSSEKRADRADPQDPLRQQPKPELSESEAHFRTLVENAPEAIVVLDADLQVFVEANQNACDLFGLTLEQLKQHDPVSLSPALQPDGQPSSLAAWTHIEDALAGDTPTFEWMHRTAAGRDVRCEVRLVRLPSSQRRLVRGSIIDVTEQRRRDEQAQEGLKMDALGRLAAGIAHDFNNLLSVMNGSATLIEESEEATSSIRAEAKAILDAARRGSSLVSQLLTFAKCDDAPARELDLNEVIRDVATFAARLLDGRITIVLQLDGVTAPVCLKPSLAVRADRDQPDPERARRDSGQARRHHDQHALSGIDGECARGGHGGGNDGSNPPARVRAVLYDEGGLGRNRAGSCDCLLDRDESRWVHRGRERSWNRHCVRYHTASVRRRSELKSLTKQFRGGH